MVILSLPEELQGQECHPVVLLPVQRQLEEPQADQREPRQLAQQQPVH